MRRIWHFFAGHNNGYMLTVAAGDFCCEVCVCGKQRWWKWR